MAEFTRVASKAEIPVGTGKVVQAGGKTLAVFNCEGTFYAVDNTCKHRGGPLGDGSLSGTTVTCPWHGWEYDVRSGECQMDASIAVQKFDVQVQGDDILVAV
ncbi:MAG: Rieske 2Fe-2S domain-containing protein [Candidatus Omnitrophica bacterium]|nr:Rieske 2Fe-2S domain-containing protein [Candidatus Omnitrophota bacterium]